MGLHLHRRNWGYVQYLFILCVIGFSAPSPQFIVHHVGHMAILPCNWTYLRRTAPSSQHPYLRWQTPEMSVFEMQGEARFEGHGYEGRVDVRWQDFEQGDCSLCLKELRFSDAGLYESFIDVHDGTKKAFVRSVRLAIRDHKYRESLVEGQDLVLKLHTQDAMTVVFQGVGKSEWEVVWERVGQKRNWGYLRKGDKELVMEGVQMKDSGIYKVLDAEGLAISTMHLSVKEIPEQLSKKYYEGQSETEVHSGMSRPSATALLMVSLLFSSSVILS